MCVENLRLDLRRFGLHRRGLVFPCAAARIRHRSAPRQVKGKAMYVKGPSWELHGVRRNRSQHEIATSVECGLGAESCDRMRIRCARKLNKINGGELECKGGAGKRRRVSRNACSELSARSLEGLGMQGVRRNV